MCKSRLPIFNSCIFHDCLRARKPKFGKRAAFPSGGPAGPGHKFEGSAATARANNAPKLLKMDTLACAHVLATQSSLFVDHFTLALKSLPLLHFGHSFDHFGAQYVHALGLTVFDIRLAQAFLFQDFCLVVATCHSRNSTCQLFSGLYVECQRCHLRMWFSLLAWMH